jgi:hypothetical protein
MTFSTVFGTRPRWEVTTESAPQLVLTKQWRKPAPGEQAALSGTLKALEGTSSTPDRKVIAKAKGLGSGKGARQ